MGGKVGKWTRLGSGFIKTLWEMKLDKGRTMQDLWGGQHLNIWRTERVGKGVGTGIRRKVGVGSGSGDHGERRLEEKGKRGGLAFRGGRWDRCGNQESCKKKGCGGRILTRKQCRREGGL